MINHMNHRLSESGFRYVPSFVSDALGREMQTFLETAPYREIVMRGQVARRRVCCFGFDYVYTGRRVVRAAPMPDVLAELRSNAEALIGDGTELCQAIVTWYPPEAGINWHRDAPVFGPTIVGVSFGSAARLHLKHGPEVHRIIVQPRSAYVLDGPVRSEWLHRVSPCASERYSVTFRSIPGVA
jgi:DNA oxidative demethylase